MLAPSNCSVPCEEATETTASNQTDSLGQAQGSARKWRRTIGMSRKPAVRSQHRLVRLLPGSKKGTVRVLADADVLAYATLGAARNAVKTRISHTWSPDCELKVQRSAQRHLGSTNASAFAAHSGHTGHARRRNPKQPLDRPSGGISPSCAALYCSIRSRFALCLSALVHLLVPSVHACILSCKRNAG